MTVRIWCPGPIEGDDDMDHVCETPSTGWQGGPGEQFQEGDTWRCPICDREWRIATIFRPLPPRDKEKAL